MATEKARRKVATETGLYVVVLAAIVIYYLIRRWSTRAAEKPIAQFDEDQFTEYQERLEKELKQFDEGLSD